MNKQSKKINNKRTIARVVALFAMILLVVSFTVPCFADTVMDERAITLPDYTYPDLPPYDKDGYRIFDEFIGDLFLDAYTVYMYEAGLSLYYEVGLERFFEYDYLGSGLVVSGTGLTPIEPPIFPSRDYDSNEFFLIGYMFDLAVVVGPYYEREVYFFEECYARLDIWWDKSASYGDGYYYMDITFAPADGSDEARFIYQTDEFGNIYFDKLVLGSYEYFGEDVNVALGGYSENSTTMFGVLKGILYGPNREVLNPKAFKASIVYGFDAGYDYGYEEGFADSFYIGYDEGYTDGYFSGFDEDLYQVALEQALQDIDDGTFGKNFLGGLFSAPFEALNSFTIVSWNTGADTVVEITLGTVLSAVIGVSLFIWFLKLFAGG